MSETGHKGQRRHGAKLFGHQVFGWGHRRRRGLRSDGCHRKPPISRRTTLDSRLQPAPKIRDGSVAAKDFNRDNRDNRLNLIFKQSCARSVQIIDKCEARFALVNKV